MQLKDATRATLAAAATILGTTTVLAADTAALDKAFDALKTFDWGTDYKKNRKQEEMKQSDLLGPIVDAIPATHGDAAARAELEARLAAVLSTAASRAAKDFVCRKLAIIGTAASVPALAALLSDESLSHVARVALERIPATEAARALRDGLSKTNGKLKAGAIGSLGVRRDGESVATLAALVADADAVVALAAASALGDIGTAEAAKALHDAKPASDEVKARAADACLTCGERLTAQGKKAEALVVYKSLLGGSPAKNVRLAATRGLLLASGKKE